MTALLLRSVFLGIGLAMDAFSVSLANGMCDHQMKLKKTVLIAFVFALFQFLMPVLGWTGVVMLKDLFSWFLRYVPAIALILLLYIGIGMIREGMQKPEPEENICAVNRDLNLKKLIIQGIATSIDALSVGFTLAEDAFPEALTSSMIIGVVTWCICFAGVHLGKIFGMKFSNGSMLMGGVILIVIGIEIFMNSL